MINCEFWVQGEGSGGVIVIVSSHSTTVRGLVPHSLGLHEWHIKSQVKYLSGRIWVSFTKPRGL